MQEQVQLPKKVITEKGLLEWRKDKTHILFERIHT